MNYLNEFIKAFITLFAIMDPFVALPIISTFLDGEKPRLQKIEIKRAIFVAGILLFIFLFIGSYLLSFLGISISSFRIAGGIILLIVGLELVLGITFGKETKEGHDFAIVPLATPLITGPGVIVTVMLLVNHYGYIITILASLTCLLSSWLILIQASLINKILGHQGILILSRIMGLLLTGFAVEFIRQGLKV